MRLNAEKEWKKKEWWEEEASGSVGSDGALAHRRPLSRLRWRHRIERPCSTCVGTSAGQSWWTSAAWGSLPLQGWERRPGWAHRHGVQLAWKTLRAAHKNRGVSGNTRAIVTGSKVSHRDKGNKWLSYAERDVG